MQRIVQSNLSPTEYCEQFHQLEIQRPACCPRSAHLTHFISMVVIGATSSPCSPFQICRAIREAIISYVGTHKKRSPQALIFKV